MNEVKYRAMMREDIDHALAQFPSYSCDNMRKLLAAYFDEQERGLRTVIVAECEDSIAGYVTLLPSAKNGAFKKAGIPEVHDLYVFEKYQRQGVGTELMNRIETSAADTSDTVCLGVGLYSNAGAAHRLFEKRGYVPDGTGAWYGRSLARPGVMIENGERLVLYMSKTLR